MCQLHPIPPTEPQTLHDGEGQDRLPPRHVQGNITRSEESAI